MTDIGHIFISYKTEQRSLAFAVRDKLREWGYETWLDVDRLQPGTYWANDIDAALKSCRACIGIMTPFSIKSRYVTNEWDMAIMKGKLFLPLMFEQTEPHYKYIDIQYIDFTHDPKDGSFSKLRTRLEAHKPSLGDQELEDPFHDYLQQLYDRINKYLASKLVTSLRDEEGRPEPIRLSVARTEGAVDALFEKREEIDPLFAIGGIADEPPQEFDDFAKVVEYYDGRVLLLGDPGSGKTITLLNYARDAIVKRRQDRSAPLPILGIIPTWDAYAEYSVAEWLSTSYGVPKQAQDIIENGEGLLLLDGLDELGSERPIDPEKPDGDKFDPRSKFLRSMPDNGQIVASCRSEDYVELREKAPLNGAISLKPLDNERVAAYLRGNPALLSFVTKDPQLQGWLSNPLLLSFFAFAFEQMEPSEREGIHNVASASELNHHVYERYVRGNYDRLRAKPNTHLAFSLEEINDLMGWVSMRNIISDMRPAAGRLDNYSFVAKLNFSEILDFVELMMDMNILISTNDGVYQFIHLNLRDHFASNYALKMIQDDDVESRLSAVYVFEETKDNRSVPYLVECLADKYARVRGTAAQLLGIIGDWRATAGLINLTRDGDKVIKRIALDAISKTDDPKAIDILIDALAHDNPTVQQASMTALVNMGNKVVNTLVEALKHENSVIRGRSAHVLGIVGDASITQHLQKLLDDHDYVTFGQTVSDLATEAIDKLD